MESIKKMLASKLNYLWTQTSFYILMKLSNNFFTKITNINWCNRNNINVAFMCYRALIWMPLWVVTLNFDVFCVSMTAQNNMARMPIRECKCELYFKIFIFSVFQRQPRTIWWECPYGSVSAGREKSPFNVLFV